MVAILCVARALTMTDASFRLFFSLAVQIKNIGSFYFFVGIHDVAAVRPARLFILHIQCSVEAEENPRSLSYKRDGKIRRGRQVLASTFSMP